MQRREHMQQEWGQTKLPAVGRTRRLCVWSAAHAVEIVFAAIIAVEFVYLVRVGTSLYFSGDDWSLLRQSGSFRGMLAPFNNHPSVTILALYRALFEVFGFSYGPFRVTALLCLLAAPVAYFVTTRRLLTPPLAAVAALSLLSFSGLDLSPSWLNHYLVLVGGIICAAALNRGRRADWVLAGALAFSLSAAGGGVAVAAACVVHNVCTRASLRRWLVVLGPVALWGVWKLASGDEQRRKVPFSESLRFAGDVAVSPFGHLGLGNTVLTAILMIAFVGYGLWRLRQGLAAASNFLAWTVALAVWTAGLAYSRGSYFLWLPGVQVDPSVRYVLLALGFVLLAVVPRRPIVWPTRFPIATDSRLITASAVVILLLGVAGAMRIHDSVQARADQMSAATVGIQSGLVALGLGPEVIPDDFRMERFAFGWLTAGEARTLLRRGGDPFPSTPATVDRYLVEVGGVTTTPVGRRDRKCARLTEPIVRQPNKFDFPLYLWSDQETWTISVRRFGTDWVEVSESEANEVVQVNLPGLGFEEPWQVRADGACVNERWPPR